VAASFGLVPDFLIFAPVKQSCFKLHLQTSLGLRNGSRVIVLTKRDVIYLTRGERQ